MTPDPRSVNNEICDIIGRGSEASSRDKRAFQRRILVASLVEIFSFSHVLISTTVRNHLLVRPGISPGMSINSFQRGSPDIQHRPTIIPRGNRLPREPVEGQAREEGKKEKRTERNTAWKRAAGLVGTRKAAREERGEDGLPWKAGHGARRFPRLASSILRFLLSHGSR
ncbi:hypothetical protein KM043_008606 [Ampulex compressa]|nr:hypothetical protein KM043_008606 [Ampulex compressa]